MGIFPCEYIWHPSNSMIWFISSFRSHSHNRRSSESVELKHKMQLKIRDQKLLHNIEIKCTSVEQCAICLESYFFISFRSFLWTRFLCLNGLKWGKLVVWQEMKKYYGPFSPSRAFFLKESKYASFGKEVFCSLCTSFLHLPSILPIIHRFSFLKCHLKHLLFITHSIWERFFLWGRGVFRRREAKSETSLHSQSISMAYLWKVVIHVFQEIIIEICPTSLFFTINTIYNVYMYMVLMTLLPFLFLLILNAIIVVEQSSNAHGKRRCVTVLD